MVVWNWEGAVSDLELVAPPGKVKPIASPQAAHLRANMAQNRPDDFQTPGYAIEYLLPFIPMESVVWDPACGKGNIVKAFAANDRMGIGTDLSIGRDFLLETGNPYNLDAVLVTNPPYSIKDAFIEHCYKIGYPFALLMPLTALEGQKRQACYKQHGLQLMILPRRISFETPNNAGRSWFATAWFCWKLNLPRDLYFAPELETR
jgi:hypothetical protein